jgi:hypothetical protein
MRPRALLAAATVALGVAVAAVVTPAFAAATPTITAPASATGFSEITISGTADPNTTVTLYESAYLWNDLQPATDWDTGGPVTATASGTGAYSIRRYVDTGFLFAVEAGGERSRTATVLMKVLPALTASSATSGTVKVHVAASPGQPWLPVRIQRQNGSAWTDVSGGYTDDTGVFDVTLAGQGPGTTQTYRAYVGADTANGITANYSPATAGKVAGTAPVPAAGSVQFTKIQYHGPGGLNNEWARLTNRTAKTVSLSGWTVKDASGSTYTFTGNYSLGARASVTVHTGSGANTASSRYWGRSGYIWNNGGDTATLRAGAKTIDSCKWTSDKKVTNC